MACSFAMGISVPPRTCGAPLALPPQPARDESPIPIGDDRHIPDFVLRCSCGKELTVPRKYAGRLARCTQCGSEIHIPNE